ncbi:CBS domain-containing protein [Neptunomonas marina]|uniref:CBS domain-containing protein n=1 Tax=Neptunomonas marina TaxID=1815562 RepID=A0A437QCK8_9GAMM|nr:CBS domain-containing protein [Neptunomonas marina]RVU32175.1 CBS domain-containing protein [Neptunomonas marina]
MSTERNLVRVADVMMQDYAMVDGLMSVKDALRIFKEEKASLLIVKKRDADDEFGLVLLSDIAKDVLAKDRSPERVNVYEVMAKPVISVEPRMDVRYCARLFDNFGLSTAPVIEQGQVVGVVSYNEIVLAGLQ